MKTIVNCMSLIKQITPVNEFVDRIEMNDTQIFEVYKQFLMCKEGEYLNIKISNTMPNEHDKYVMCGTVYYVDDTYSCISNGGLLSKVKVNLCVASNVYTLLSKSRVRKRNFVD